MCLRVCVENVQQQQRSLSAHVFVSVETQNREECYCLFLSSWLPLRPCCSGLIYCSLISCVCVLVCVHVHVHVYVRVHVKETDNGVAQPVKLTSTEKKSLNKRQTIEWCFFFLIGQNHFSFFICNPKQQQQNNSNLWKTIQNKVRGGALWPSCLIYIHFSRPASHNALLFMHYWVSWWSILKRGKKMTPIKRSSRNVWGQLQRASEKLIK